MVDEFRRREPFRTELLARRVARQRLEPVEPPVLEDCGAAAARPALGAVGGLSLFDDSGQGYNSREGVAGMLPEETVRGRLGPFRVG